MVEHAKSGGVDQAAVGGPVRRPPAWLIVPIPQLPERQTRTEQGQRERCRLEREQFAARAQDASQRPQRSRRIGEMDQHVADEHIVEGPELLRAHFLQVHVDPSHVGHSQRVTDEFEVLVGQPRAGVPPALAGEALPILLLGVRKIDADDLLRAARARRTITPRTQRRRGSACPRVSPATAASRPPTVDRSSPS